jgi:putative DNA primase/helicase
MHKYILGKPQLKILFSLAGMQMENRYHEIYKNLGWKQSKANKNFFCINPGGHSDGADSNASLTIDNKTGMFYCHACGLKGNFQSYWKNYLKNQSYGEHYSDFIIDFLKLNVSNYVGFSTNVEDPNIDKYYEQLKELHATVKQLNLENGNEEYILPPDVESIVNDESKELIENLLDVYVKNLLNSDEMINYLYETRRITIDMIKELRIGLKGRQQFVFPMTNENNDLVNFKLYNPLSKNLAYKWSVHYKGRGRCFSLYKNFYNNPLIICSGEPDMYCAIAHGFKNASSLGSEKNTDIDKMFGPNVSKIFKDKTIIIVSDSDKTGEESSKELAFNVCKYTKDIKIINLDKSNINPYGLDPSLTKEFEVNLVRKTKRSEKDLTDFLYKNGFNETAGDRFRKLIEDTPVYVFKNYETIKQESEQKKLELFTYSDSNVDSNPDSKIKSGLEFPFNCLGFNNDVYFYYSKIKKQVVDLTPEKHKTLNLLQLAPLEWFQEYCGNEDGPCWKFIVNELIKRCHNKGYFSLNKVRGVGTYLDDKRIVTFDGVNGITCLEFDELEKVYKEETFLSDDFKSEYIYETSTNCNKKLNELIKKTDPLPIEECRKIIEIFELLPWEKSMDAMLCFGWTVTANLCGILPWRAHVQITGSSGVGKTWIIDNIIKKIIGNTCLHVSSNTTEAGIRQTLKHDARPVLFDEAEGESYSSQNNIQKIIELARQASSDDESNIVKGTKYGIASSYSIKSSFCFASISVMQFMKADKSRFSILSLVKEKKSKSNFDKLSKEVEETLTDEFVIGFEKTIKQLIPLILKYQKILSNIIAELYGNKRDGDQFGTLLVSYYILKHYDNLSYDNAKEWIKSLKFNIDENENSNEEKDEYKLLNHIIETIFPVNEYLDNKNLTIGEIIIKNIDFYKTINEDKSKGSNIILESLNSKGTHECEYDNILRRNGIRLYEGITKLAISNSNIQIAKILCNTPWPKNWKHVLKRLPGTEEKLIIFRKQFSKEKAIIIPITLIIPNALNKTEYGDNDCL